VNILFVGASFGEAESWADATIMQS